MFDAWRWRYSRAAEVALMQAVVVGNRIPFNKEPVDFAMLLKSLPLYSDD